MTTLITGGTGFIGSRLALGLIAEGESIVILDNFNDYYDPRIKRENIASLGNLPVVVEGDIRDEALIKRMYNEHSVTRVALFL